MSYSTDRSALRRLSNEELLERFGYWRTAPWSVKGAWDRDEHGMRVRSVLVERGALPELGTPRIAAALAAIEQLPDLVGTRRELDEADSAAWAELSAAVAELLGVDEGDLSDLRRGWGCPWSPTVSCVYNVADDPSHDDCLYCHLPSERK